MTPGASARQFSVGDPPLLRGEIAGEGEELPIVLCHGLTATRHSVVHGSRVLERAGHPLVTYDARGHGESDPAPASEGYGYPQLIDDLEQVVAATAGEEPILLGGHSMGAHTAVGYALRHRERVAGLIAIGPTYTGPLGESSPAYWDGLATALQDDGVEGFLAYIDRELGDEDRAAMQGHLHTCKSCFSRMEFERLLKSKVGALRDEPASPKLGERVKTLLKNY